MPESCAAFGCTNRREKGNGVSFHKFPLGKAALLSKWVVAISRADFCPSKHHVVCSEHFEKDDYIRGIHPRDDLDVVQHELQDHAVPSIFPAFPAHKQRTQASKRPPPKRKSTPPEPSPQPIKIAVQDVNGEHGYATSVSSVTGKLKETTSKLQEVRKELKVAKQKVKRQSKKISCLLQAVRDQHLINQGQLDLLKLNFGENTFTLIENELTSMEKEKHGHRFSEQVKQFAVTLHFYSAQAYEFVRQYLHLPHPSTIRKWSASLNCQPGFLTEVINHIKEMAAEDPLKKHCMLILDAMAIKKEVVYDPKSNKYAGFTDCGNLLPSSEDSLATEALVFMTVGLTGNWKFPVAYYLADHLSAAVQAQIIKQLICVLTEAGMDVHGVVCDGTYANQTTASRLGCSITPSAMRSHFPHPSDPSRNVYFVFDACHLIKLVRNCVATLGTVYLDGDEISWRYIERLYEAQQKDNLHLANKLKAKHIMWQQHTMNVKVAVQALSSSVADAIDFLREDLGLPGFAGSEPTTKFIRIVDKLFDLMNSKHPRGKGYKSPMRSSNIATRQKWLLKTQKYLKALTDEEGQPLCMGRRKTAWVGFMATIDSVLAICHDLLSAPQPFYYVCTYKMSQDHLEMFFSRVRRRGGWNNNPNCLQFKWALRAILLKNRIMPSKNANVSVDEPLNELFKAKPSASVHHTNANMQTFAELLREPSEFHEHILHYLAGYISRHVTSDCKCTQCCVALHKNASDSALPTESTFTTRKDRGGLIQPRDDVFQIVKTTDRLLRQDITSLLVHCYFLF